MPRFFKLYPFTEGYRTPKLEKEFTEWLEKYQISSQDLEVFEQSLKKTMEFSSSTNFSSNDFVGNTCFVILSPQKFFLYSSENYNNYKILRSFEGFNCYEFEFPIKNQGPEYFVLSRALASAINKLDLKLAEIINYQNNPESRWQFVFLPAFEIHKKLFPHYTSEGMFLYDEFGYNLNLIHELGHLFYEFQNRQSLLFKQFLKDLISEKEPKIFEEWPLDREHISELFAYLTGYEFCKYTSEKAGKEYLEIGRRRLKRFIKRYTSEQISVQSIFFNCALYPKSLTPHLFARLFAPAILEKWGDKWKEKLLNLDYRVS